MKPGNALETAGSPGDLARSITQTVWKRYNVEHFFNRLKRRSNVPEAMLFHQVAAIEDFGKLSLRALGDLLDVHKSLFYTVPFVDCVRLADYEGP